MKDCNYFQGYIVGVADKIHFLDFEGNIHYLNKSDISLILTYGTASTPFSKDVKLNSKLAVYIRKIEVKNSDQKIIGFPFNYVEDLVFLQGLDSKIYVVALKEIQNIENHDYEDSFLKRNEIKRRFDYSEYVEGCLSITQDDTSNTIEIIRPSRVLGDQIKINEFIENHKKGYRSFLDLQSRTQFYAKPYLYPKRSRLGLTQIENNKTPLPLYFQWSTGEDYHFQSVNSFGGVISKILPLYDPGITFNSTFKSHFFHGYFEGNFLGISTGSLPGDFKLNPPTKTVVVPNFNYAALMGVDWKQFSFSYGGVYFTPFINFNNKEAREIAANSISPTVRLDYIGDKLSIRTGVFLLDDKSSSNFEIKDQIEVVSKNGIDKSDVTSFSFKGQYYRIGVNYNATETIDIDFDLITGEGKYKEAGTDLSEINYESVEYLVGLKKKFGHYITLKFLVKNSRHILESTLSKSKTSDNKEERAYGGVFELLF